MAVQQCSIAGSIFIEASSVEDGAGVSRAQPSFSAESRSVRAVLLGLCILLLMKRRGNKLRMAQVRPV